MKVMLLNGSPHRNGTTATALHVVEETLKSEGIDTLFYQIPLNITACRACYACRKLGHCVIDDEVNDFIEKMKTCDGLVIGSPVHYASASGLATAFLDRAFFSCFGNGVFEHKPGTAIACARRAGTTAALDQLNKYFTITQMPIISGRYWNMVHGAKAEEIFEDKEGIQNLKIVARNMVWHLKCQEAAQKAGIMPPPAEKIEFTNFIR